MTVTKDSIIGDVLDFNPETAPYFLEMGIFDCFTSKVVKIAPSQKDYPG